MAGRSTRWSLVFLALISLYIHNASSLATCDFYLTLEGQYSNLNLSSLNIKTGRSLCAQGSASAAGRGTTLEQFIATPSSTIASATTSYFLNANLTNGLNTTDIIVLDIEVPVLQQHMNNLNTSVFPLWAAAFRRRVQIARSLMPYATLGVYGVVVDDCGDNQTCLEQLVGRYQAAARLGMYDEVDIFCPRYYPTPQWTPATAATLANVTYGCTAAVHRSDGSSVPVAPFLSYVTFPGIDVVSKEVADAQLHVLQNVLAHPPACPGVTSCPSATELHSIHFWAGDDNATLAVPWFNTVNPAKDCSSK